MEPTDSTSDNHDQAAVEVPIAMFLICSMSMLVDVAVEVSIGEALTLIIRSKLSSGLIEKLARNFAPRGRVVVLSVFETPDNTCTWYWPAGRSLKAYVPLADVIAVRSP